jgi:uncharacterized protein YkwD
MNWVDLALILTVLLAVWAGWRRGFIRGSLDLLSWTGSIVCGFLLYPYAADAIGRVVNLDVWLLPVAFILSVVLLRIIASIATRRILSAVPEKTNHSHANRLLGILPGAANGIIYATVVAALLLAIPFRNKVTNETVQSDIAMNLAGRAEWANKKLAPVFDAAVRQTMSSFAETPAAHEPVSLHFTCDNPVIRPTLETQMLELINIERTKEGLKPLRADRELTLVARAHSKDMFARGYFAHENQQGEDPFDRMKKAKVKFKAAGENLALAQTLELAHTNLMNSPGHRANILNPDFGRVGIGILDGGFYGLMVSQEFRD